MTMKIDNKYKLSPFCFKFLNFLIIGIIVTVCSLTLPDTLVEQQRSSCLENTSEAD